MNDSYHHMGAQPGPGKNKLPELHSPSKEPNSAVLIKSFGRDIEDLRLPEIPEDKLSQSLQSQNNQMFQAP